MISFHQVPDPAEDGAVQDGIVMRRNSETDIMTFFAPSAPSNDELKAEYEAWLDAGNTLLAPYVVAQPE